jgi:hypothetical protein
MNIIKKLTLIIMLSLFSMSTAYAACDCANPKNLHCKMVCKIKGEKADPAQKGDGFWKKLKLPKLGEIGGKPVDNS